MAGLDALSNPQTSLVQATMALDRLYGSRFIGRKAQLDQKLAWPRIPTSSDVSVSDDWYYTDSFGNYRDFNSVPAEVIQATVELAVLLEAGFDLYAQPEPLVLELKEKLDVLETQAKFASPRRDEGNLYKINVILAPLLSQGGTIKAVR